MSDQPDQTMKDSAGAEGAMRAGSAVGARETIDFKEFADHSDFGQLPEVGFGEKASLAIAWWVLGIFAGALLLAFAALFVMMYKSQGASEFEKIADLLKFLITSIVPLVTLAVGYYLGDKNRHSE